MKPNNTFTIYLAGKMSGLTHIEMNTWRLAAQNRLSHFGLDTVNPCDYYNFELDPSTYTDTEVMQFDLWAVRNSDLILVNLDYPDSIGTAMELYVAHEYKIPIIAYRTDGQLSAVHPWVRLCCAKICGNLDEAIRYIAKYYGRVIK